MLGELEEEAPPEEEEEVEEEPEEEVPPEDDLEADMLPQCRNVEKFAITESKIGPKEQLDESMGDEQIK